MLFSNFLCLFYLMVLTRCHTISKSIESYDNIDDVIIDRVNDYPFTSGQSQHGRIPKYRHESISSLPTSEFVFKAHETTTESYEKAGLMYTSEATKRKVTTHAPQHTKTKTKALETIPAPLFDTFNDKENLRKPMITNLFKRVQNKFRWRNRTSAKGEKRKNTKKKLKAKDKINRGKRVASDTIVFNDIDEFTNMVSVTKTIPEKTVSYEDSKINANNLFEAGSGLDLGNYMSGIDKTSTLPIQALTSQNDLQDNLEFSGTESIEAMLDNVKKLALEGISAESRDFKGIVTNAATETVFDFDPVRRTRSNVKYADMTEQPYLLDFKDVVDLSEDVTSNPKPNARPNPLENKLQKDMFNKWAKAKGTFAVGINKAYDHVKGVTWKALHSAANELNDIANKIEHSDNVKEIPGANPSQIKDVNSKKEKLANNDELTDSSTPKVEPSQSQALKNTTLQKPSLTNEREHLKHNLKTTTPRSKFAHFSKNNHSVTKNSKGRPTTIKNKRNKFDTEGVEQTDYIILKNYEDVLRDEDTTTTRSPIIAGSRLYVKGFKDKLVKRDTETTENFNYKETGRQSQEVEEKPETDEMLLNEVEISTAKMENDGSTYQMTEATLHEIANPDDSYSGLTNKIHFDEYINGYKNYLNFTKEFSKFNDEYSNHVRYQAHRHHSVDDIGKFILTRLPTIPQWKSPQRKKKSGELYEPLEDWHEKLTTKSYESWFKRHFNLNSYRNKAEYTARSWKYDPKLGENDGLKFELQKGNQKKVVLDWLTHDKRLLGENEGLKVGWKWRKKMPKEKNVVSSYANDANENMVNANDATEKLSFNFDKMQKDLEVNDLVKSSVKMAMSNMYPEYTTPKDSISTNLNLKKLLADMSTSEISYVAPENEKALNIDSNNLIPNLYVRTIPSMKTRRTTEETTIDLDRLLSQISATTVTAKTVHLNELDSAYVLRNMPDENLSDISKTLNLRRAISKEIHKFTRNAKDNNVDDSFNTDGTEDNNLKSSRISIAPNEESLIKSTLPPNIFQDAALYPQKDATSNKGYVNLNVVDKPPTKKKKKNKFLCFDKWKFKKKKSKDTKDKKLERKSRIAKRSAFKKFKTLFKSAKTASNEPDHSTYETTESFSKKYVDMDVEELMKLVPHDSTGETTSFQMDPVTLKTSTFSESMAHTDLIPHDTTKLKQRKVKKYQKKLDAFYNNFKIPLNFRVSSSLKAKPTTILTIAVTPDESKNEFGLKVIESKLNNNEVSGVPKVYVTHSEDSKDLKFTPKLQSKVSTLKPTTELDQMPSTYLIKNKNKVVDNYLNEIMKGDTQKETPLQDVDIKNMINDFTCEDKTKNSFKKQTLNKDKDDTHIKSFRDDAVKDTVNNQDEIQTPYNYSKKKKRFSENDAQKGLPVPVLKNLRYGIDVTTDGIIKYESNDKDFAFYMNHQNNHKNNQRLAYSKTSGTLRTLTQKRNSQEMTTEFTKGRKSYLTYPDLFNDLIISNQDILSLDRVPDMSVANMLRNNIDATNPNLHVLNDVILGMDDGSTNTYTAYATTQAVPISKNTPKIKSKTARDAITNSNTVKREVKYNEQKLKTHFLDNNILRLVDKYGSSQNTMTSCVNCATESTKDSTVFTYDDSNLSENFNEDARNRMPKSLWSTTNSKSTLASKTKMIQSPEHYFRTPVPMKSDEFEKFLKDNNLSITKITAPYNKISQFEENWAKDNHIKSKLMDTKDDHDEDVQHSAELTALSSMKLPQSNKKNPGKINKNEVKTLKHTTSAYNSIYNHDNAESGSKAEGPIFNIEDVKIKRTIKTQPKITNPSTELDFDNFDITIIDIDDIMSGSDSDDVITPKENNTPAAVTKTTQKLKPQVLVSKDPLHRNENSKSANKIFSKYKPLVNSDSVESDTFLKTLDTKVNRRMKKVKGKTQCDKKSKAVNGQNDDLAEHLNVDKFVKVPEMATRRPSGESVHFSYYEYKHEHISAMPSKQYPYTSTESDDEFDDEEDMRDHNHNEFKPETQKTHTDAKLKQQRKSYAYSNRPSALTKLPDLFFNKERVPTVNRLKENFDPHQKLDKQPQRITFTSHTLKYDVMYDDISKKIKMHQQAFIQPLDVPLETTTPEPDAQKTM